MNLCLMSISSQLIKNIHFSYLGIAAETFALKSK